jgi:phage baseplate assembly protein gpV
VITYDHAAHALTADVMGAAAITTTGNINATIGGTFTGIVAQAISITGNATAAITIAADFTATVTGAATVNVAGPSMAINAPDAAVTLTAQTVAITAQQGIAITAAATIALTTPAVAINAAAFSLSGSLSIGGEVIVAGAITSQGDIQSGAVSLLAHKHKDSLDGLTTPPIPQLNHAATSVPLFSKAEKSNGTISSISAFIFFRAWDRSWNRCRFSQYSADWLK